MRAAHVTFAALLLVASAGSALAEGPRSWSPRAPRHQRSNAHLGGFKQRASHHGGYQGGHSYAGDRQRSGYRSGTAPRYRHSAGHKGYAGYRHHPGYRPARPGHLPSWKPGWQFGHHHRPRRHPYYRSGVGYSFGVWGPNFAFGVGSGYWGPWGWGSYVTSPVVVSEPRLYVVERPVTYVRGSLEPVATAAPAPLATNRAAAGELRLSVWPQGALVYLDGEQVGFVGAGPLVVSGLTAGEHSLEVVNPGYQAFRGSIVVGEGTTTEMAVSLTPLG